MKEDSERPEGLNGVAYLPGLDDEYYDLNIWESNPSEKLPWPLWFEKLGNTEPN